MDTVRIDLLYPCHRGGWFGAELTGWLLAAASGLRGVHLRPVGVSAPRDAASAAVAKASVETFGGAKASVETFGAADGHVDARVLVVRDGGRSPDLAQRIEKAPMLPVALVAYGGRARGRPALDRARAALERAGVPVATSSLGINAAAVREEGFADADALLWSLLLEDLRDAAVPAA